MSSEINAFFEPRFGHDFSRVRVHADAKIGESTRAVAYELSKLPDSQRHAVRDVSLHNNEFSYKAADMLGLDAFTIGNHIHFGRGRWQLGTREGLQLLNHELTHVSRGEGRSGSIEGWSSNGHRTITFRSLENDSRFSPSAQSLLANTAPVPDYNTARIAQDMISFWSGGSLLRAPAGFIGGAIIGSMTPPEQGTQIGGVRISGALPQAILGSGQIPTVPSNERERGGTRREELSHTRVPQELANHGEDLPERNLARTNEFVNRGVATANLCDLYNGLVQLGYGLHVAQDRGSHGDGYTANYVLNRPHSQIDSMALNSEGVAIAIANSRDAINSFFVGLTNLKKQALSNSPMLGLTVPTRPPVLETLLAPPSATSMVPPVIPEESRGSAQGINILSIQF